MLKNITQKLILKYFKNYGPIRKKIDDQKKELLNELGKYLKPYSTELKTNSKLPEKGQSSDEILSLMKLLKSKEESRWKEGYVSGAVYHGDESHIKLINEASALFSQSNPLHSDLWPSIIKFESEIISMTSKMLNADLVDSSKDKVCGTLSSGGSESILLAMKTYRDLGLKTRGIELPNIVIPQSAHAAFYKAAQYFKIELRRIPVDPSFRADVKAMKNAVDSNTVAIVGSAPCFPHGVIDPIEELSEFALKNKIGFHTDACLGGFLLPWIKKLGFEVPKFDFELPGVTSISIDTHKYGFAPKGSSVILYRNRELIHYQYFKTSDWPGGLYYSPTFSGSRPGSLIAGCWAAMMSMGEQGYLDGAKKIMKTAEIIKKGINAISDLKILGNPLWVIAMGSDSINIHQVMDQMTKKNWNLNGLHLPASIHICLTLRHTEPGVAERFIKDLQDSVETVKNNPKQTGGLAPIYGMAAQIPDLSIVDELMDGYIDMLYSNNE